MRFIPPAAERLASQTRRARSVRGGVAALMLAACATVAVPGVLAAQVNSPVTYLETETGAHVPIARHKGFQLFGEADLAASGLGMTGDMGWFANDVGPCPWYFTFDSELCGRFSDGTQPYFEITWLAGAPISEFRKIRAVHPGISDMKPPIGYTAPYTFYLATPQARRWGPADGQFGNLFSGVTTTDDGSCRDDSDNLNGRVPNGFTLLASSDCPEAWSSKGFQGLHAVTDEGWLAAFQADPANFHFDDFRLPESAFDPSLTIGSISTYGETSDSYREIIQRFGGVTKLGSGPPSERGYPLGLDLHFDAFQFGRPSIASAVFYRVLMINNSARIYGTGIDYDSLYFGMAPGILSRGQNTAAMYHDFKRNTVIMSKGNISGRCSATYPSNQADGGCPSTNGPSTPIFGIAFLKSPLGDARFRLFSDPASPYYNPGSPFADDTITFNHGAIGGFGFTYNSTFARNDRALFGYMSNIEDVFLDGRNITDFSPGQLFTFFESENYDGTISAAAAKFNKYAPGNWDYNNDGIQDTISVPSCGQFGCSAIFSDSIAGGLNNQARNVGNIISAGPFALGAGDTTEFVFAFTGAVDSLSFENLTDAVLSTYLGNYAGPQPVPPPAFTSADVDVTSADIRDSTNASPDVRIRIRIGEPDPYDDKFVVSVVTKTLANTSDSHIQRLLSLNPTLLDDVAARVRKNYSELLVFKSCDNGQTFTVSADCTPAEAEDLDGSDIGFGWQPIEIIPVDTLTGHLTTRFFSDVVQPGREYLYSFVTRTRGLIDIPVIDSAGSALITTNLAEALTLDADTVNSPLFRSGPHTVKVYAPITRPAGTILGQVDTTRVSGLGTAGITITPRSNIQAGTYRLLIANRFIITTVQDTLHGTTTQTVIAQRVLPQASVTPDPLTAVSDFVSQSQIFTGTGLVATGAAIPSNRVSTVDSIITFVDTVDAPSLGFILTGGTAGEIPLLLSDTLASPGVEFEQNVKFPGFLFGFANEGTPRADFILRSPSDTLSETVANNNAVGIQDVDVFGAGGVYKLEWQGDAFGPGSPFLIASQPELQPQVNASFDARPVAQVGDTTAAVEALLPASSRPLVPVKLPFRVIGPSGEQAVVAMRRRNSGASDSLEDNSLVFGTGVDTSRIEVPADAWVPGDELFILTNALQDSTVGSGSSETVVVKDTTIAGQPAQGPIQVRSLNLDLGVELGCDDGCNPIALGTRGSTGYLPMESGWTSVMDFSRPLDLFSEIQLTATATNASATPLTDEDLAGIRIVPNPYIVQSDVDVIDAGRTGQPTIMFTGMPAQGKLRIYTVSGQFVQQISWTASDLVGEGSGLMTGDLPYNLRSREGLDLGSGLYIAVITPTGPNANGKTVSKKFVLIR